MEKHPGFGEALPQNGRDASELPPQLPENEGGHGQNNVAPAPSGQAGGYAHPFPGQSEEQRYVYPARIQAMPLPDVVDILFALFLIVMGFCFWDWQILDTSNGTGVGATLFFCLLLAGTCMYLFRKGITQTKVSIALFVLAVAAALPFALFGAREIDLPLLFFEVCLCLLWLACSCKSLIAAKLTALISFDLLSQTLLIPFVNFGQLFVRGIKGLGRRRVWTQVLITLVGLLVSFPIFFIVISLLRDSDEGFRLLVLTFEQSLDFEYLVEQGFKFVLGIPIACYIFGVVVGNAFKRYTPFFKRESLEETFVRAHVIPRAALYGVLLLLTTLYTVYFIAVGSYLISALQGSLPAEYTYAEFARQGFFELCGVAVINLCLLGMTWIFAHRAKEEYPPLLRVLTGLIVALTCLLVVIAASKMWLYIQVYGLTLLRVYTSWFMLLLLVLFLILLLWHIRPFNAAKPIIVATVALVFLLAYTNVDGLVARYNVEHYLAGQTERIDTHALANLSDAAVPALRELQEQATDSEVRLRAEAALSSHWADRFAGTESGHLVPWEHWYDANLVSYLALPED